VANLRFRLHVKWGTVEVPLKTPLLPLNTTAQDIADSFGCSPPDATAQRKSYRLWLVAINPRTGGFEEVITRNGAAVVISADDAPVRPWDCDPQHTAQVNGEFASYMTWRAKNTGRHPTLTDSVMIATIAHHSGQVSLTALPRDLWSEAYKTRINALYMYGRERMPEHPTRFVQDVLSELIGSPLHYVIVLSPHQVAEVIDLVGGIELTVPSGFVDHTYPRDDVDITKEKDPAKLYETVTFTPGAQRMDGQVAMKYMRSRHAEGTEGTDTARSARQQLVIQALLQRLRQRSLWEEPQRLGKLYAWYNQQYRDTFPLAAALGLLKTTLPENCLTSAYRECPGVSLQTKPVTMYPEDPQGMIEHPDPRQYNGSRCSGGYCRSSGAFLSPRP
jgi:LCP family protein required for cell wall assembly